MLADGNTVSAARSRSSFFSRSAIIKQTSQASEFFYPFLHPYIHYLPVTKDFHDLKVVIEWARDHDAEMQAMADKARTWAEGHLLDESVMCYVSQLLHRYHGLQTFTPFLTKEMLRWRVNFTEPIRSWVGFETQRSCATASLHPVTNPTRTHA